MTKYCSNCGNLVYPQFGFWQKFCEACGRTTNDAISYECEKGHDLDKWQKFCPRCGAPRKINKQQHEA